METLVVVVVIIFLMIIFLRGHSVTYDVLNGNDQTPFVVDLKSWPDCDSLLTYLENKAGITVLSRDSCMWVDDYFAEFEYKTYSFELATTVSSPWLLALKGCPSDIFDELLMHVSQYNGRPVVRSPKAIIKYMMLPEYQGIYSKKD